jgi:hypothetical protein
MGVLTQGSLYVTVSPSGSNLAWASLLSPEMCCAQPSPGRTKIARACQTRPRARERSKVEMPARSAKVAGCAESTAGVRSRAMRSP